MSNRILNQAFRCANTPINHALHTIAAKAIRPPARPNMALPALWVAAAFDPDEVEEEDAGVEAVPVGEAPVLVCFCVTFAVVFLVVA